MKPPHPNPLPLKGDREYPIRMEAAFAACEAAVRKFDPDRYFSALFAPAQARPLLFALYAFNHELARIGELVREPMTGEMRLHWWRETLDGAREGQPRSHDVARALAQLFARTKLPHALFDAMMDARTFDFSPEPFTGDAARDAYLDSTSGNLMRLAARVLGVGEAADELAREAGIAYGLAGLIRSTRARIACGRGSFRNRARHSRHFCLLRWCRSIWGIQKATYRSIVSRLRYCVHACAGRSDSFRCRARVSEPGIQIGERAVRQRFLAVAATRAF